MQTNWQSLSLQPLFILVQALTQFWLSRGASFITPVKQTESALSIPGGGGLNKYFCPDMGSAEKHCFPIYTRLI